MITFSGALNAQTAESPCDCHEFFNRGVTGETWNISELDPIVNCTRFRGTIVIDEPTSWEDLSIRMETGSSIQVATSLRMDECNIGTCDDLWRGIEVLTGVANWITVTRSTISGANIAIELNDHTIYFVQNNHFVNNHIGISTGSPYEEISSDIVVIPGDGVILGCHFYTETQVPDPYVGHNTTHHGLYWLLYLTIKDMQPSIYLAPQDCGLVNSALQVQIETRFIKCEMG